MEVPPNLRHSFSTTSFSLKCLLYIEQTLVHDIVPEGEQAMSQVEPQLELNSEGLQMVLTFKDNEEKDKWKQQLYNSKMHLQEEELKKTSGRPRRRATKPEQGAAPRESASLHRAAEGNLLKTVGGGGLKRTAANIEAFRSKNLNSTSISHLAAITLERENAMMGVDSESEGAALEKLKKAVEAEEEKKDKLSKELAEIEEGLAALQNEVAAQKARNAELERSINEAKAKGARPERRN